MFLLTLLQGYNECSKKDKIILNNLLKLETVKSNDMKVNKEVIRAHRDGVVFNVFVTPNSERSVFPKNYNKWRQCIDVDVCSSAENYKANKEVIKLIADFFNKNSSDIHITKGSRSREKTIFIEKIDLKFVYEKLRGSLYGL